MKKIIFIVLLSLATSNLSQASDELNKLREYILKDPMTTAAAIDQLVHHSIILELHNDSYRAKAAKKNQANARKQKGGKTAKIEHKS